MKKKLLLTSFAVLSSIGLANAVCTPPTTLKCECAHPIINSEGKLACGASYCGDKKCMENGSCCTTPNEARTECCDQKGNGIANDDTCCPPLTEENCQTETDTATGCLKCKTGCSTNQHECSNGTDSWCCDKGYSCGMTKDSCSSCSASSFDDRTCYGTEDCSYLQNSCEACGWEWTPYIDGNTDLYICGGYDFCQARYGGGIWDKRYQNGSVIGYGCVGDGYCQAVHGAGTWQITQSSSATEHYGCGGNDYCAVTVGGNSVWKCSEDVYMGTMCSCTQAS